MKKLLAILLVLGMASMASAALTYQVVDTGGNPIAVAPLGAFAIQISGTTADAFTYRGLYDAAGPGGAMDFAAGGTVTEAAGDLGSIGHVATATYDGYDLTAWDQFPTVLPNLADGLWFELPATGLAAGVAALDLWDATFAAPLETIYVEVIPEPMTLSLLGLGGLLLRRRR